MEGIVLGPSRASGFCNRFVDNIRCVHPLRLARRPVRRRNSRPPAGPQPRTGQQNCLKTVPAADAVRLAVSWWLDTEPHLGFPAVSSQPLLAGSVPDRDPIQSFSASSALRSAISASKADGGQAPAVPFRTSVEALKVLSRWNDRRFTCPEVRPTSDWCAIGFGFVDAEAAEGRRADFWLPWFESANETRTLMSPLAHESGAA